MPTRNRSLATDLANGALQTRPLAAIEADLDDTLRWAEEVARTLPGKVRRGRPPKGAAGGPSRSVTVRFPEAEARLILASAERQGQTLSEFVRAAACKAAAGKT
jgi:hypothetical protein